MREGFTFDRTKIYGFDYENSSMRMQAEAVSIVESAIVNEDDIEMSAKEAFDEFARGPEARQPWPPANILPGRAPQSHRPPTAQPAPMPTVPPLRPPTVQPMPMPTVPPRPQPPRPVPQPRRQPPRFNHFSGSSPRFAPPAYIPQRAPGLRAVDPGAISRCLYSNTYVWLNNGQGFWFFPTFIGRRSIAGFRWMHNHWIYKGFDLGMIQSFFCGGR